MEGIFAVSEPAHESTYWYNLMRDAINARAAYRRRQVIFLGANQIDRIPAGASPVIVIGATGSWMEAQLGRIEARGLRGLLLSTGSRNIQIDTNMITLSSYYAASYAVRYLYEAGRRRVAMIGCNVRSLNDGQKLLGMHAACNALGLPFDKTADVFRIGEGICACLDAFAARCETYDAVVCANDVSGVALLRHEQLARRRRVPEDLHIVSFGNTRLAQLVQPSLTSITLDFRGCGTIAVDTVLYLRKHPNIRSQCTEVMTQIIVGGSTAFFPARDRYDDTNDRFAPAPGAYTSFYKDPTTRNILHAEQFLGALDETDLRILLLLLRGEKTRAIPEALYISESAVKYRLRKMLKLSGHAQREPLLAWIGALVDADSLDTYILKMEEP